MQCYLKSLASEKQLELKNNEKLEVGRSKATKIKDSRISRNHLELTANYARKTVLIKQIGPNDSTLNGRKIGMGLEVTGKNGDTVELIVGEFPFKIVFEGQNPVRARVDTNLTEVAQAPPKKLAKMFLPKSMQDPEEFRKESAQAGTWEHVKGNELLIYWTDESLCKSKPSVAAFDMDGTLITTKSGRVFPKDDLDWRFLSTSIVSKCQTFSAENTTHKFLIFTNQAGLEKNGAQIPSFKKKIESITKSLGIPIIVFISTGKKEFRKPMTGSWDVFVRKFNEGIEPERETSFYCGDAAGRKKDHSLGDRLFALNLQLLFLTPEDFFQGGKPQEFTNPLFNPRLLVEDVKLSNDHIEFPQAQEMIILVGYPGSGKSSFVKSNLLPRGFVHVNRDSSKSMQKCVSTAQKALNEGISVVIDNTNGTKKAREEFLKVAKKQNCVVRCFKMMVDFTHAQHNNKYRQLSHDPHDSVPMVAFNTYRSQFQEPTLEEGFSEIVPVNFVPEFLNEDDKKLYSMFLLEK